MSRSTKSSAKGRRKRDEVTREAPKDTFSDWHIVVGIFVLALLVRLIYLFEIKDSILFTTLFLDPRTYDQWALRIATESFWGEEVFYQPPLYPYFLGVWYLIFGHNHLIPRIAQILMGSTSCVILFLLGNRLFSRLVGIVAALIASVYWIFIYFDGELLIPTLILFLDLLLVFSLVYPRRMSWKNWVLAGLIMGLSATARPNILIFFPFVLLWLWLQFRQEGARRILIHGAVFLGGVFLMVLPVTLRNYSVGNDLVLISSNGGINFFIGNNAQADGRTVWASRDLTVEKTFPGGTKPSEESGYWTGRALQFVREDPLEWVNLMFKKLYFFWNSHETSSNKDIYHFVDGHSGLLRLLSHLHFGIIAPLAFVGMMLFWKRWRRHLLLYFFVVSYTFSVILFFVNARYRVPIVPFLMLFAAQAICWAAQRIKRGEYKRVLSPLIVGAIFAAVVNSRLFGVNDIRKDSPLYSNLGEAYCRVGRYDLAVGELLRALEIDSLNAQALNNLGVAYDRTGRQEEAVAHYEKALAIDPDYAEAHNNLGSAFANQGRYDEALAECGKAVELNPESDQAHFNLGEIYRRTGNFDAAIIEYKKALDLDSSDVRSHNGLGTVYLNQSEHEKAMHEYQAALRIAPDNAGVHNNLGNLYLVLGEPDRAMSEYLAAIRLNPRDVNAHYNLATILQQSGRDAEAAAEYRAALRVNPGLAAAHRNLGLAYLNMGKREDALESFNRSLQIDPSDELAREYVSRLRE